MRAVNQSIGEAVLWKAGTAFHRAHHWTTIIPGRAIRHANDYATLLLVDRRYSTPRISGKLPKWIRADLRVGEFGDAVRGVAGFFKEKKTSR
jgi:hypothetical protein